MTGRCSQARAAALVGPFGGGKTSLLDALLFRAGAIARQGRIKDGSTTGDSSPEARARQMSVEPNMATAQYLDERWTLVDCPGSVEFLQDTYNALTVVDDAVVVVEPDPARAVQVAPLLKFLDERKIPHLLFINKVDGNGARLKEALEALQAVSERPLVLREVALRLKEKLRVSDIVSRPGAEDPPPPLHLARLGAIGGDVEICLALPAAGSQMHLDPRIFIVPQGDMPQGIDRNGAIKLAVDAMGQIAVECRGHACGIVIGGFQHRHILDQIHADQQHRIAAQRCPHGPQQIDRGSRHHITDGGTRKEAQLEQIGHNRRQDHRLHEVRLDRNDRQIGKFPGKIGCGRAQEIS